MHTCLLILTITLFLLTLYSILQNNAEIFHLQNSRLLSIKILDTSSAATLFVTLLGALLVRHQFAVGVLPRINYISTRTERANKQNPSELYETWRVEIRNTGLGSAIINQAEYSISFADISKGSDDCTIEELIKALTNINLINGQDYWIGNMTNGFSLSPKDDFFVFEIKIEHVQKFKRLNLLLYFQGQLGDKYKREILLIPRQ